MKKFPWLMTVVPAIAIALAGCGQAPQPPAAGDLEVESPWSREVPAQAPVAAGFLTIHNHGSTDDRLVTVRTDAAERVEIHETRREDDMVRMRALPDGLPLPAGDTVELRPGGYHLMFIGPRRAFRAGEHVDATLVFAEAGEREVEFEIRAATAGAPADAHEHH